MAVNVRPFEIVGAVMAIIFVVFGVVHLARIKEPRDTKYVDDMNYIAVGCFLIFFNVIKALVVFFPETDYPKYFGYLHSWVGRGLQCFLMGFYLYPSVCYNASWTTRQCLDNIELFEKVCLICIFMSFILGLLYFFGRCFLVEGHDWRSVKSESRQLDALAVLALVSSVCILLYAGLMCWEWYGRNTTHWWYHMYDFSVITFVSILALFSFVAAFRRSRVASTYFGFLYYDTGRGLFYFMIGMYMYAMNPFLYFDTKHHTERLVCMLLSVVCIVTGVVCLLVRIGGTKGSSPPPPPQTEMAPSKGWFRR
jgi:hypothetical protein